MCCNIPGATSAASDEREKLLGVGITPEFIREAKSGCPMCFMKPRPVSDWRGVETLSFPDTPRVVEALIHGLLTQYIVAADEFATMQLVIHGKPSSLRS